MFLPDKLGVSSALRWYELCDWPMRFEPIEQWLPLAESCKQCQLFIHGWSFHSRVLRRAWFDVLLSLCCRLSLFNYVLVDLVKVLSELSDDWWTCSRLRSWNMIEVLGAQDWWMISCSFIYCTANLSFRLVTPVKHLGQWQNVFNFEFDGLGYVGGEKYMDMIGGGWFHMRLF